MSSCLTTIGGPLSTPRSAIWISLYGTTSVMVINTILTVVASTRFSENEGLRILFNGSCSKASNLDTGLHVIINILSIILLTASNFTMQYVSSPTRTELDAAHSKGDWMDIGVPSMRNLTRIDRRRATAWMFLALTSVPLAILYVLINFAPLRGRTLSVVDAGLTLIYRYNCVTFQAVDSNDYDVYIVTEEFFSNPTYDANATNYGLSYSALRNYTWLQGNYGSTFNVKTGQSSKSPYEIFMPQFIQNAPKSLSNSTRLSNKECIKKYSSRLLTGHKNLLAVTKDRKTSVPAFANNVTTVNLLFYTTMFANRDLNHEPYYQPFDYLCSGIPRFFNGTTMKCSPEMIDPNNWSLFGYEVDYCISEVVPECCLLLFSPQFSIAVIGCNFCKLLCMVYALLFVKRETLFTQG